jgi:phosphatidate cytidylyltransferase
MSDGKRINFLKRTLTGAAFVALIVGGVLWNRYSFGAVLLSAISLCLLEFYDLVNIHKKTSIKASFHVFGAAVLFAALFNMAAGDTVFAKWLFVAFIVYLLVVLSAELFERQREPLTHAAYILFGHCYITLPVALLPFAAFRNGGDYDWTLPLALLVFIWINDTFAYLVGVSIGRHRLFKRISPKKSWEGFFGGLIFTVASAFLVVRFKPEIPLVHWLGLALATVILATFGDLVESLIKRTLNVKDSSAALPGHGGFLDRFDSLLFAAYGTLLYHILCW